MRLAERVGDGKVVRARSGKSGASSSKATSAEQEGEERSTKEHEGPKSH